MRHQFGGNRADWVMEPGEAIQAGETIVAYIPNMLPNEAVTFWDAETGGTQITDLQDPDTGDPLGSSITTDGAGNIPAFLGPDGVTYLWGSASVDGSATRYAMTAIDVANSFTDVTNELAALDSTVTDHGTRITSLEARPSMAGWHVVTDDAYGATGDGTTDDTAAIQAALDAIFADGGGVAWVPGGTYSIATGPLRIYGNTRLALAPDAVIRRDAASTMLLNGDAAQDFGGYTGHGNIIVEGGTWDANGTVVTSNNMGLSFGHAENVTVRDTTILDVPGYHAIEYNAIKAGRIENVRALGFIDTGSRAFSEAVQVDLAKSSSVFGGFGPYDHTPCEDILVQGCTIGPSGTAGTTSWGRGVGSHSATATVWHRSIRITANHITQTLEYAVGAYVWDESAITGNIIDRCGAGIWMRSLDSSNVSHRTDPSGTDTGESQPSSRLTIADNVITDSGSTNEPILTEGEATGHVRRATVDGNVCAGVTTENGIRLIYTDDTSVSDNAIHDADGTGISTENCTALVVTGNRIRDCDGSGITLIDNTDDGIVEANSVRDVGQNGLWAQGGSNWIMANNVVHGAGQTAGTYYGIRITTSASYFTVSGNRIRAGTGTIAEAISITGSCDRSKVYGNDARGGGTITNGATNPDNTATDTV